jgi:hypothetical protein
MKTINLWVNGEGWKSFDYDAKETKQALKDRNIQIGDSAEIGNYAKIGDYAKIGNSAKIRDYAEIGDYAKIGDKEVILKTIFITGTKHTISWWGKGIINIGCHKKEIEWWLKNFEMVGKKEGYTDAEIEEYHQYILICEQLQKSV